MRIESRDIDAFAVWLKDRGAEILAPATANEMMRFRVGHVGAGILYQKRPGSPSFANAVFRGAYKAFRTGEDWRAPDKAPASPYTPAKRELVEARDGEACLFCGCDESPLTLAALLPLDAGGTPHTGNLALVCDDCAHETAGMHLAAKLRFAAALGAK